MYNTAICGEDLLNSTTKNGKNVEVELIRREDIEKELQLAWLGGFIEGEGCFTAGLIMDKRRGIPTIRPRLVVSNSVLSLLEKVSEIIKSYGASCHVVYHKRKDRQFYVGNLSVIGNNNLLRIVPRLLPYLFSKKAQAELVIAITNRKIELSQSTERVKGETISTDPILLSWIEKLHALKQVGKTDEPSTTTRCTPQSLAWAVKRTDKETLAKLTKLLGEDDIVCSTLKSVANT